MGGYTLATRPALDAGGQFQEGDQFILPESLLGRASGGGQQASVVLTLDVYSHLLGSMQRDAADRIDEILK